MIARLGFAPSWTLRHRTKTPTRLRLICFPHAGAGASCFAPWGSALEAAGIEMRAIQYPGREARLHEPSFTDVSSMVEALAVAWPDIAGNEPYACFGHSMGAVLAFELALKLQRTRTRPGPLALFLSGRNPAHTPSNLPPIHLLPDAEFLDAIESRYGRLPAELRAHQDALDVIVPILRADFTLVKSYVRTIADQVYTPLTILGGESDPWTTPADLAEWSRYSYSATKVHMLPGDHFFHQQNRPAIVEIIRQSLADWLR